VKSSDVANSRILVVDDQVANLEVLATVLEFAGYAKVRCESDPRKTLATVAEFDPDLLLLDLHMPHLDGLAVMDQLRTFVPADDYLPVIVLTGDASSEAREKCLSRGASDFLSKPLNHIEVELRVRNLLQTRWLHQQRKQQNAALERQVEESTALAEELAATNRRLALSQDAFHEQTKLLQSILDSMGDGVIAADEHGKMLLLNPAAKQIIGTPANEVDQAPGRQASGVFHPGTMTPFLTDDLPLAKALRGEDVEGLELYVRNEHKPQGAFVRAIARPLVSDSGEIKGSVAVIRDVTSARQAEDLLRNAKEEAERANLAKSEFLSRMSHELRTPLNSILGFAQILEMDSLGEEQSDSVAHIMKGGKHLLSLINEVLDLARIEAGRLSLSVEAVQLREVIQESLAFVRPIAQQRNIRLREACGASRDRHVQADRQRLRQVLLNLLSNAVKYNELGGTVEVLSSDREDGSIRISVTDTGFGIPVEHQSRLFQPFERLADDNMSISGTGLGLALSKRLVEAMGGHIGVESKVGQGSVFWIDLAPAEQPPHEVAGHEELSTIAPVLSYAAARTVLYIEDNEANLKLMERIVTRRPDLHLAGASRALEGLEQAEAEQPDLILLDLHLPDLRGQEVVRRLKSNPKTAGIPVVILSADITPGEMDRLLEAGADSYVTKPVDVGLILGIFDRILAGERADREMVPQPQGSDA